MIHLPTGTPFGNFLLFYHGMADCIWPVIDLCSKVGVFHADARRCLLARPVDIRVPLDDLMAFQDLREDYRLPDGGLTGPHDAWHIIYASGKMGDFFDLSTIDLPWVIWERDADGKPRKYQLEKVKRKIIAMGSQPKQQKIKTPNPDPITTAVTTDELAQRQQNMQRRKKGGYYGAYTAPAAGSAMTGGDMVNLS